jgi:predicted nucleic acid-binding protein
MEPQSFLPKTEALVFDTSSVINLNATGRASEILDALPYRFVVVDGVVGELAYGKSKGRRDATMLAELVDIGVITLASLGAVGLRHFETLVVGASATTVDDGEAATIAYAVEAGACAIIDERKATRLCSTQFPDVEVACTLDLLSHVAVRQALPPPHLADAVYEALFSARMRVPAHHMEWVVSLIGADRAVTCRCLPESVRHSARSS